MVAAFLVSKLRKHKAGDDSSSLSEVASAPDRPKTRPTQPLARSPSVKTKMATFLSDNDNFFGNTEVDDRSDRSLHKKKKKLNFKKVFQSDTEGRPSDARPEVGHPSPDGGLNEFYFAVYEKLKH